MDLIKQLDGIFYPKAITVVGASASTDKIGYMFVSNLVESGYKGEIYPVNPNLPELLGLKVYHSVSAIPGDVDLAIVSLPASLAIAAVEDCAAKGAKGVLVVSGGFREVGTSGGLDLQTRLREIAENNGIKIIGPNTLGVVNPGINLVASFQPTFSLSKAGGVALVTQSGGMSVFIVYALTNHNIGVGKAIGLGNRCNLDFDEVLTYLAGDEDTKVIILYIEGVEQPEKLIKLAREVVKIKPIVVYKGGRYEESNKASLSHTGVMIGNYEFYKAAFTQSGMVTVDSTTELVDIARALDLQPPASGNRVAILSVQAGPAIVIADKCRELGLQLARFSTATLQRLRQLASPLNAIDNPVDVAWKANEFEDSLEMLKVVLEDDGVDAVIVSAVYYPTNMQLMRAVAEVTKYSSKPVTVCLDSPCGVASAELEALERSGIPTYPLPERAVSGLAGLVRYGEVLRAK